MKKFLAVIASVILAISVFAFAGCKDKETNPNVIEGNYKQATAEEVKTELSKVDISNAFGDATAEGYKLGFELSENLSFSIDTALNGISMNYSIGTDTNYKLLCTDLDNLQFTGSGYANLSGKATLSMGKESQTVNMSAKTNLYNDSENVYVDLYEAQGFEDMGFDAVSTMKIKASFNDILDYLDKITTPDEPDQDEIITPVTDEVITDESENEEITDPATIVDTLFAKLDQLKIKVALDAENGLKLKLSFDKDSYEAILALAESDAEADGMNDVVAEIAALKEALIINTFNVDIYVAFDAEGLFTGFAVDCNIDAKIKTANIPDMPMGFEDMTLKVTGGMALKTYAGDITLPAGIATDSNYSDIFATIG